MMQQQCPCVTFARPRTDGLGLTPYNAKNAVKYHQLMEFLTVR